MNKYVKLISFSVLIVGSLLGFSLYQVYAGPNASDVEMTTIEGNSDELSPVEFSGNVFSNIGYQSNNEFMYEDGSISYLDDLSFFDRVDFSYNPLINRLTENHRSFMRGKARQQNLFAETDTHVAYTGMAQDVNWSQFNSNTLTVSVLNKETEEEQDFEVDLENNSAEANHFSVLSMHVNYPELTIFASAQVPGDYSNNTLVYTFDIEEPTETLNPTVNLTNQIESNDSIQLSESATKTDQLVPFRTASHASQAEFGMIEPTISDYYIYDIDSNEVITVPDFDEEDEQIVLTDDDTIYVGRDLGETIELHEMDRDTKSLHSIGTLDMVSPPIGSSEMPFYYHNSRFNSTLHVVDSKLFAYGNDHTNETAHPIFQVIDLANLETIFSGRLEVENAEAADDYQVSIIGYDVTPPNE